MSQVRANSITNAAGTGAPDFPNGATFPSTAGASTLAQLTGYTVTTTTGGTTFLTNASTQYQLFQGGSSESVRLPDTSTLAVGWTFRIVNGSAGTLTIRSSGGFVIIGVLTPLMALVVTCVNTAVTDFGAWSYGYTDFGNITGTGSVVLSGSPNLTGTPLAPTAAVGTNTTQIATTAFVNSQVGTATAGLAYGGVGTYAWLVKRDSVEITAGSTYSGASLVPGGAYIGGIAGDNTLSTGTGFGGATGSGALSGTWRAHGSVGAGTNYSRSTLFLRIS